MRKILVRLREAGQLMTYFSEDDININDYVIIETDRGMDYGEVMETIPVDPNGPGCCKDISIKNVTRKVNEEDRKKIKENEQASRDALKLCARKAREYQLSMKLVDAEYSFDQKKIIFYFTSEGRIDFRELVKELAKIFKIRIEMRQIGVRDEARIFGGIGPCGQTLCCVRFLKNFEPVTMKMAKVQRLPLSSGKISGICSRLMCCLSYEFKTYRDLGKGLPKEGSSYETPEGKGKVIAVNVLKRMVYVQLEDSRIEKIVLPMIETPDTSAVEPIEPADPGDNTDIPPKENE
jgi:cell fate regulator YaaT (PSP1 superfamily)